MQALQLLVEIFAQPLQFVGVAQFVGVHDLVETGRIGLVVGPPPLGARRLRRTALGRFFSVARIAFVLELRRRRFDRIDRALLGVVGGVVGRLALHRILSLLVFALAFRLVGVLGRRLVVRLVLRVLGVGIGFVGDAEGGEELADEPAIGALVEEGLAQPVEIGAPLSPR